VDALASYHLAVLLAGFGLLTVLAMRGVSIFLAAPASAALVLAFSGADPLAGMTGPFMEGFADFLRQFYLIFALGAAFGKLMEKSGAAATIARAIVRGLGPRWACLAVVLACAVLTYGGVSLFVVGFSVYPLALQLFRQADLPRRFIPGAIAFGSVTFTMTTAGSPEIQNLIPIKHLVDAVTGQPLTDSLAGWPASLIVAAAMFLAGQVYLEQAIGRARRRGERFEPRPTDPADSVAEAGGGPTKCGPGLAAALTPLLLTLVALNALPRCLPPLGEWLAATPAGGQGAGAWAAGLMQGFPDDPTLAIFVGVAAALATLSRHAVSPWAAVADGFHSGLMAIGSTCAVVGFGKALVGLPAFQQIVQWVTHLPGDPLIGAAVAVAVIAGLAGSASGGQGLALPIIKPIFVDQMGVAPRALHRVVSIASGSLDTLPANGYLVMLIRNICGETHASSYWPICVTCTIIPAGGTALAIGLFKLVPAWGQM
jgi:H+/gluconate symporter-like permease